MMTLMPLDMSRGVCSIQSTGQKGTQASQPVQLSGITTAISLGFFFLRVIFAGASGIIAVGFAFFGSYPAISPFYSCLIAGLPTGHPRLYHVVDYARFRRFEGSHLSY